MTDQNRDHGAEWLLLILVLCGLAAWVAYNAISYGDWTCAFARCVKVHMVKP